MNIASSHSPSLIKRIFASGAIGNLLETYDLILISLMATTLSQVFFPPSSDPYAHIIDILYVFFISLLMRPLGNIIMALFADQIGRKKLMFVSLTFTGVCSILIGILPSYQSIGVLSTILFVLIRVCMNFFAGIEYVNSATYLIENSDKRSYGFFASWSAMGISGGYLLASFISFLVTFFLTKHLIPEWGWRFIFLFSSAGIVFGLWMRYSIPESLEFMLNNSSTEYVKKINILKNAVSFIRNHPKHCLSISALTVMGTCLSYIYYIYIPLTIMTTRDFGHHATLFLNIISLLLVIVLIPLFGKLSDNYNRIKLLKIVCVSVSLLAVPFFWTTVYGSYLEVLLLSLLISIPSACFFSLYPALLIEKFPSKIRCTASSLIYQIVFSVILGVLPLLVKYLTEITKIPYIAAYLLIISTLIGYLGIILLQKNTSPMTSSGQLQPE